MNKQFTQEVLEKLWAPNEEIRLSQLLNYTQNWAHVGSSITCDPPPDNTDNDILCLTHNLEDFTQRAEHEGFEVRKGSTPGNQYFTSMKKNNTDLIVTTEEEFYTRFMRATKVAKKLNLLKKEDRVTLFQAILYHNDNG